MLKVLLVHGLITLLTDFGLQDAYVGAMKGVILGICSTTEIIDISHAISRHSIRQGAFLLLQASAYFPEGTIHLAVIDPGVGTARRRIAIKSTRCIYVGPDNGVLFPAANAEGIEKTVELVDERFMLPTVSKTFEGRDIFAPVAAYLAKGIPIEELGPEIHDIVELSFAIPTVKQNRVFGEIVHIDTFGNIITNISRSLLDNLNIVEGVYINVSIDDTSKEIRFCRTYGDVPINTPLMIIGSTGFLEVCLNQGSAMTFFKAVVGSKVEFSF